MRTILVAGASGFIGHALIERLLQEADTRIIALSRRDRTSTDPRIEWRKCDLYSLKDIKETMAGCDLAYYLVHSMLPSAGLSQGHFYDFDLLMADNFVRASIATQIKRIVYLGGLIPKDSEKLSWHLKSRLEVEKTLRAAPCDVITLRAGLIIGREGSSFFILRKLVERLPVMVLPSWTRTRSEPIALEDVIRILVRSLTLPISLGTRFDIGGSEKLTYRNLILRAAKKFGKKIPTYSANVVSIRLSRFWVSLITGAPRSLVYPLVLSLKHEMLVDPEHAWPHPEDIQISINDALERAMVVSPKISAPSPAGYVPFQKDVRSIQRLNKPEGKSAEWVTHEYFKWLPNALRPLMQVDRRDPRLVFRVLGLPWYFLILEKSLDRSTPDRQLLYIRGGLLAQAEGRGRLEFREVLDGKYVMAAIHEYRPRLPWFIYRFTQAVVHLWVMRAFGRYLERKKWLT
jgi:uncharacterized protein YbjT (DUF2867 family)